MAQEAGGRNLVKLEALADQKTPYPDMAETLKAAEAPLTDGFEVMVSVSSPDIMRHFQLRFLGPACAC